MTAKKKPTVKKKKPVETITYGVIDLDGNFLNTQHSFAEFSGTIETFSTLEQAKDAMMDLMDEYPTPFTKAETLPIKEAFKIVKIIELSYDITPEVPSVPPSIVVKS